MPPPGVPRVSDRTASRRAARDRAGSPGGQTTSTRDVYGRTAPHVAVPLRHVTCVTVRPPGVRHTTLASPCALPAPEATRRRDLFLLLAAAPVAAAGDPASPTHKAPKAKAQRAQAPPQPDPTPTPARIQGPRTGVPSAAPRALAASEAEVVEHGLAPGALRSLLGHRTLVLCSNKDGCPHRLQYQGLRCGGSAAQPAGEHRTRLLCPCACCGPLPSPGAGLLTHRRNTAAASPRGAEDEKLPVCNSNLHGKPSINAVISNTIILALARSFWNLTDYQAELR
ncbi:uncharacterized protein LOC120240887 [Hyaena hyaena]|uniref:uncharacterized protein LOC120240887 n=1 Tax=Hyaena hyaena TaxID=95912 RepID=UPI0019228AA8|nr:uncharacterized protein LOC120240887 [Hyaena hyaena]